MKLFHKIASISLGLSLALGVGVVASRVGSDVTKKAKADASTYQHIFNAKPSTGNNVTLSSVSWTIAAENLGNYNSGNYAGVQIGTSSKNGSITLTSNSSWSYSSKPVITEIRLWLNLGGTSVTPSVTIGGTAAISDGTTVVKNSSAGSDYTKATKVTFTPATNHNTGVVVINVQSVKAGYICAMEIDSDTASVPTINSVSVTPSSTTVGINSSITAYANVNVSNDNGSLNKQVVWSTESNLVTLSSTTAVDSGQANAITISSGATEGEAIIKATSVGNNAKFAQFTLTIIDSLASIKVTGNMTKTTYLDNESWDPAGLVVTATLASGATPDITSSVNWTYDPSTPALAGVGTGISLKATAHYSKGGVNKTSYKTITVDVEESPKQNTFNLSGQYLIKATRSGVTYYLQSNGTTSAPSAVISVSKATPFTFNLVGDDQFTIKNGDNYLYMTDANNGVKVGSTSFIWTIEAGEGTLEGAYNLKGTTGSNTRYLTLYNASDWRCYTSATQDNREENTDLETFVAVDLVGLSFSSATQDVALSGDFDLSDLLVLNPAGANQKVTLSWESANEAIATVDEDGVVSGVAKGTTTITVTATDLTDVSASISITVKRFNSIKPVYDAINGSSLSGNFTIQGRYVGSVADGPIFMDGEYGMIAYHYSNALTLNSDYTITGTGDMYYGLAELKNCTITPLAESEVETPIIYNIDGTENTAGPEIANRLCTLSGTITTIGGSAEGTYSADHNNTIGVNVGGNNINLFIKSTKASSDYATSMVVGKSITVSGFTSFYTNFQVAFESLVQASSLTATEFAEHYLGEFATICAEYDGVTNNHDALNAVWTEMQNANNTYSYYKLSASEKNNLVIADIEGSSKVDQFMAFYEMACIKYNLTRFIEGRSFQTISSRATTPMEANSNVILAVVIVVTSVISLTAVAGYFLLKKKHA